MRRGEYIKFLTARGYQPVNENQVKLGMSALYAVPGISQKWTG